MMGCFTTWWTCTYKSVVCVLVNETTAGELDIGSGVGRFREWETVLAFNLVAQMLICNLGNAGQIYLLQQQHVDNDTCPLFTITLLIGCRDGYIGQCLCCCDYGCMMSSCLCGNDGEIITLYLVALIVIIFVIISYF